MIKVTVSNKANITDYQSDRVGIEYLDQVAVTCECKVYILTCKVKPHPQNELCLGIPKHSSS